eukprot:g10930.t1
MASSRSARVSSASAHKKMVPHASTCDDEAVNAKGQTKSCESPQKNDFALEPALVVHGVVIATSIMTLALPGFTTCSPATFENGEDESRYCKFKRGEDGLGPKAGGAIRAAIKVVRPEE